MLLNEKEVVYFAYIKTTLNYQCLMVESVNGKEFRIDWFDSTDDVDHLEYTLVCIKDWDLLEPELKNLGFEVRKNAQPYRTLTNIEHLIKENKKLRSLLDEYVDDVEKLIKE